MAIQTAIALAPAAISLADRIFGKGRKASKSEKQAFRMADLFLDKASTPLTQSRAFKSGMSILGEQHAQNRKAINNQSAITGATDEAKIANTQVANQALNAGMQRLLHTAGVERGRNIDQALSFLKTGEQSRQNRVAQRRAQIERLLGPFADEGAKFMMSSAFGG